MQLSRSFSIACFFFATAAWAQPPTEFRRALPGYDFQFPRDHGSHPDFQTEWWYFTGNVSTPEGRDFGYKFTIFRNAISTPDASASPLVPSQVYLGHFAISDMESKSHQSWERVGRTGLGQGEASTTGLDVRVSDWTIGMDEDGAMYLHAKADGAALDMVLKPQKPFVTHGENGMHKKADVDGQASHYISFTRLDAQGSITWNGETSQVSGLGWMDHEFGTNWLSDEQIGWDWFAIQLDNGEELMLYGMRLKDGTFAPSSTGSRIDKDGKVEELTIGDYRIEPTERWTSPESGATYPMGWRITIDSLETKLRIIPTFPDQEMMTVRYANTIYWEGAVRIEGTVANETVAGKGYVELVGYAGDFRMLKDSP